MTSNSTASPSPDAALRAIRVLIVAPNASSRFGGEAVLPLKYFQLLRRADQPVFLLTHARNRADLESMLGPEITRVHFIEDSRWHRVVWRMGRSFPDRIKETLFGFLLSVVNDIFQNRAIRALVAEHGIELIHQPIPVSPKTPSSVHGFGVPVVIGPMNGGMSYPPGFEDYESRPERLFVPLARWLAIGLNRIVPGKRRAAALLVANERTRQALPVQDHPRVITLVENGVDLSIWKAPAPRSAEAQAPVTTERPRLRLAFMGRLVDWKATDITLEAIRRARNTGAEITLDILGDGPERPGLEALRDRLELGEAVRFHGFRPQTECAAHLQECDALILNSLRECGGAVVLEAMSLGLPVIASDWGGPADYVSAETGILVAPSPRATFADRLADAINQLARDPALRQAMGQAGRQRIETEFDWATKVAKMRMIYTQVLEERH